MSMGIGKQYWVQIIKFAVGDLDEVIKFIEENRPADEREWIDLQPGVHGDGVCAEYCVSLVKMSKPQKNGREE